MPRRALDLALVLAGGLLVLVAVYAGADAVEPPRPAGPRVVLPHGDLARQSRDARAGIDPFAPPGLPAGASIDPETGLLRGLDLAPPEGAATPGWLALAAGNAATGIDDLPAGIRALDGQRVILAGFMMALYALRDIHEFALVGSHTKCCFGIPPGVGDQVVVTLHPDSPGLDLTLAPLRVDGTFRIRPQHLHRSGEGPLIWLYEVVDARVRSYAD